MDMFMKPCSPDIVSVLLSPQRIHCILLEKTNSSFAVRATSVSSFDTVITFAQPSVIESTIRTFLVDNQIPNAFVSIAVTPHSNGNVTSLAEHLILQCQLLAINTPFHCAGITTPELAYALAVDQHAHLPHSKHALCEHDLMCSIGLYLMALT